MSPERLNAFVSSWFFAPFAGSADLDIFKRLIHTDVDYRVVQARRERADPRLLERPTRARFSRTEVALPSAPRTRAARDAFQRAVLTEFSALAAPPDFILSHSNEVPSHRAAWAIKQQNPKLPWVAYFGDVVTHNPYVRHMSEYPLYDEDCRTEQDTLREADVIICNNDHQRQLMLTIVPSAAHKTVTVPHCFEATWYPADRRKKERGSGPFTFAHLGTLYAVKRSARPLLDAVELLLDVYPELAGAFRVRLVGDELPEADRARWGQMRHAPHVEFQTGVSYLESLAIMTEADVLIVIDGVFDELPASPYLPGKLADYLGAGRPLLASTMRTGATADVLARRGEPLADADPERLAFVMKRHIDGRVTTDHSTDVLHRAELVGASMELCFRAAMEGAPAVRALATHLTRLTTAIREAVS